MSVWSAPNVMKYESNVWNPRYVAMMTMYGRSRQARRPRRYLTN